MENPNAYMEAVVAARSILISEEESLAGTAMLSQETQPEDSEYKFANYVEDSFADFLTLLRKLPRREQDLLLAYYCLGIKQENLARILCTTQTLTSADIRHATQAVAAILLYGGEKPSAELLSRVLIRAGAEEQQLKAEDGNQVVMVKASQMIVDFAVSRSYADVAEKHRLHRPEVRRCLRGLAAKFLASSLPQEEALGGWLTVLTDKTSAKGAGYTVRQKAKFIPMYRVDSTILGKFEIDVSHPDFDQLFSAQAAL